MFEDRILECIDCQQSFTFTAGEQEFYDRKGFKEIPKRCKSCRENRKQRRPGGNGGGGMMDGGDYHGNSRYSGAQAAGGGRGGGYGGGGGGGGGGRELYDAVCAACGAPARVPFRPVAGRPVYCRDCYSNRSAG